MNLLHQNITALQGMKMTNDVNLDFARLMAIHHKGALTITQEQAGNGQNTLLVNRVRKSLTS